MRLELRENLFYGDHLLLNKDYGIASLEWDIPDAPDVKFRIGSITKQFTAAMILLLHQDCKLNIDDTVSKPSGVMVAW